MAAEGLPVKTACRMLEVTCGGYYAWLVRPPSERSIRHAWLTDEIRKVHADSRQRYGARRIHAELRLGGGIDVGRGQIELLMQRADLKGLSGRRKWPRTPSFATAVDLVERQFERDGPYELWVTDVTEHPTREGKLYCAVVLDTFSHRAVGWSIDSSPTAALVTNALVMAIDARAPQGTIIHSDQGTQSVHLVGLYASGAGLGAGPLNGIGRGLLRQRHDRVVLVTHAGRTPGHTPLKNACRAGQCDLRIP